MNLQQQAFIDAYLTTAKGNGAKAARTAGYSERSAGVIASQLLKKPAIKRALERQLHKADLTTQARLERLARIADAEPKKIAAADVIAANRLILQVNGALKDKQQESGITVNIGFLQVNKTDDSSTADVIDVSQVISSLPQLSASGSDLGADSSDT